MVDLIFQNFNNQEIDSHHIIFNEIIISFLILEKGGNLVVKVFDIFNLMTIQVIYLLYNTFEDVYLYKPHTSRSANSEKYIVCKNYTGGNKELYKNCYRLLNEINESVKINKYIFLNLKVPNDFIHLINEYNNKYVNKQNYYLNKTLDIINNKIKKNEIFNLKNKQIINAINWCKRNKMSINKKSIYYTKLNRL